MNKIITISRQYGSGGREIGKKIAEHYGIPFYDNEIIKQAAKESGFSEQAFHRVEDKATNSFLYSIAMGMNVYSGLEIGLGGMSVDDRIYITESKVIRDFAKKGPCVIVGRCADYVLRDLPNVVNLFIYASLDFRIKRATEEYNLPTEKAAETILKQDKRRANYYNYHVGEKWANMNNYHLAIRSDFGGIDHSVSCIEAFLNISENE